MNPSLRCIRMPGTEKTWGFIHPQWDIVLDKAGFGVSNVKQNVAM